MKGNFTYRLKYAKSENARYISHLDFVRVLNRTIKRSNLPVTYTEGFNPHPVMVVAMPIGVGATSEDEYIDIDFDNEKIDQVCSSVKVKLNFTTKVFNFLAITAVASLHA